MPEKTLAKKSAAMKACIRLYEIGELNEHFLPRDNEAEPDSDDEKKDPAAKKEGTKKQKKIYPRKVKSEFSYKSNLSDGQFIMPSTVLSESQH